MNIHLPLFVFTLLHLICVVGVRVNMLGRDSLLLLPVAKAQNSGDAGFRVKSDA